MEFALSDLREATPNGRDYNPQGPGALREAVDEQTARVQRVRYVKDELEQLYNRIDGETEQRSA